MITQHDFIHIPFQPEFTQSGIDYALCSLPYTYDRMGGSRFERLRRIVAGKAVELAFRSWLEKNDIRHDILGTTPFTRPDRYDLAIGGRRCDLKSFQFFSREMITRLKREPALLLGAAALVPSDQLSSDHLTDDDLYVFAFLSALVTTRLDEIALPEEAGQPVCIIHPLPEDWARPNPWGQLGKMALKADVNAPINVEVGGQGEGRDFIVVRVALPPRERVALPERFYSVAYLRAQALPTGRIGLASQGLGRAQIIEPHEWGNIWVYGMNMVFTGYITHGEFRRCAESLPAGSRVFQYARTRTHNHFLPIEQLHPLDELMVQVRGWQGI